MDKALVSVIIRAFDAAANIRQTLNSALAQTYQDIEEIVHTDPSSFLGPGIYGTFIGVLLNLVTDSGGKPLVREVLPLPTEKKGKAPNVDCKKKRKRPSILDRTLENIEPRRWSAGLDDGD